MGKGGKSKGGGSGGSIKAVDDDALLDAAIAENKKALSEQAEQKAASSSEQQKAPGAALSKQEIMNKLNQCPTFCILNGQKNIVGLKDPTDPTGQLEACCWFADPNEAKQTLDAVKEANQEMAPQLHLGVTPLGVAYALAAGWAECHFFGDKLLRGSIENFADGQQDPRQLLREQALAQGLEPPAWHVPCFCCDELQSPTHFPVFLSRKALAEAWVVSGRKIGDIPANLTVMDLGVLVCQMQTDVYAWSTLQFICERKSLQLVKEAREKRVEASRGEGFAQGLVDPPAAERAPGLSQAAPPLMPATADEAPPPLEDEPPPLE